MIINVDQSNNAAWDEFVGTSEYGGFMQSSDWEQVKREEDWDSFRLGVEENGALQATALVLSTDVTGGSLLLYSPQGPVLDWHKPDEVRHLNELIQAVKERMAGQPVACWRIEPWALHIYDAPLAQFERSTIDMQPRHTALIPLIKSEEEILAGFKSKVRYNMRLAERNGVTTQTGSDEAAFKQFYEVYRKTVDRKSIEYKEYSYFESIQRHLGAKGNAFAITAFHEDIAVASILLIRFGNKITYFFGGFEYEARHLMSPYACHLQAIRLGIQLQCDFYDLWGIANTDDIEHPWHSFTEFKAKFNPVRLSLCGAYDIVFDQERYREFRDKETI